MKSVCIRSFSGAYSVRMRDNTDQKNSKYRHFSCNVPFIILSLGGKVAGAGDVTVGGAQIDYFVRSRTARKQTKLLFVEYNSLVEQVKNKVATINRLLEDFGEMETDFSGWVLFWRKLIFGSTQAGKGIVWDVVKNSLSIVSYTDDAARIGAATGATLFKTLGNVGKGIHIAGSILGTILVPFDIYTLVISSIDEHNRNPHQVSETIREQAKELAEKCPPKDEIDKTKVTKLDYKKQVIDVTKFILVFQRF